MEELTELTKSMNLHLVADTHSKLRRLQEDLFKKGIKLTLPEVVEGCIKSVHEKGIINTAYWTK